MTESQLRDGFARLVEPVVPAPEAYNRVVKRGRKRRRARMATWTGVLAALIVIPFLWPVGGGGRPAPGVDDPLTQWAERFLAGPAQGGLAAEPGLVADLEQRFRDAAPADKPQAKVAYVDDVGQLRVAFVILHSTTTATGRWVYAGRGASPQALAGADAISENFLPDQPFVSARIESPIERAAILLAPAGCSLATAPLVVGDFATVPGGVLFRDYRAASERWQVTCDGMVSFEGPSWRAAPQRTAPTGGDLAIAMQAARGGRPDRDLAWLALSGFDKTGDGFPLEKPVIRYSDSRLAVAVAPVRDGWKLVWAARSADGQHLDSRTVPWDLRSPGAALVLAPDPQRLPGDVFALGPPAAQSVRLAGSADSWPLDADGSARVVLASDLWPLARLEFIAGDGTVLSRLGVP